MSPELQREVMLHWAEKQKWRKSEKKMHILAEEIAELIFWGITFARSDKSVRLNRKEKE